MKRVGGGPCLTDFPKRAGTPRPKAAGLCGARGAPQPTVVSLIKSYKLWDLAY